LRNRRQQRRDGPEQNPKAAETVECRKKTNWSVSRQLQKRHASSFARSRAFAAAALRDWIAAHGRLARTQSVCPCNAAERALPLHRMRSVAGFKWLEKNKSVCA